MKTYIIALLGIALVSILGWVLYQNPDFTISPEAKTYKIGILYRGNNFKPVAEGFVQGMNSFIASRKSVEYIEEPVAGPEQKDFDAAAAALVAKNPDLIFVIALEPIIAIKKATAEKKIPVVLTLGGDPALLGLIKSFKQPGDNLTGISWDVWNLSGKRLEILKMIDPRITRVFIFGKRGSQPMKVSLDKILPAAETLGIETIITEVETADELTKKVGAIENRLGDAIYYAPDPFIARNSKPIIEISIGKKLPTIFHEEYFAENGALASYGANFIASGKQAARIAASILFDGKNPAELPIESPDAIDLVINLSTAEKIGVAIPQDILIQAQKIIR